MVPTLGESVTEATVATWFKKPGDAVTQDEMLCELETDKVSVEVPAPASGTLSEIIANEGDTVQANGKLAVISGGAASAVEASDPGGKDTAAPKAPAAADAGKGRADVANAPSAEKLMAEKGLSAAQVTGTGRDGRIMKEDVMKAVAAPAPAASAPAPGTGAPAPPAPPRTPRARNGSR